MTKLKTNKLSELKFDKINANKHSSKGQKAVENSLQKYGAGRSILVDKDNNIIAGNLTAEVAGQIGLDNIQFVETDGKKLIVVKRTDLDINSKTARELAIADNRTSELSLNWDEDALKNLKENFKVDLKDFFSNDELLDMGLIDLNELTTDFNLPNGDKSPFQQITFTLADAQAEQIKSAIVKIKQTEEYKYVETMGNENSNGNALYLIIMQWAEQKK